MRSIYGDEAARRADQLAEQLVAEGKIIEAGFAVVAIVGAERGWSSEKIEEMKLMFLAGAQHLHASIMTLLDPGTEPTLHDIECMTKISEELLSHTHGLELWLAKTVNARAS